MTLIGALRLGNPIANYDKNPGIHLDKEMNLLNEVRGVSGAMLYGSIAIGLGVLLPQLKFTSFVIGTLVFLGFALGRIISIVADGKPNKKIVQGILFELVFSLAHVFGIVYNQM